MKEITDELQHPVSLLEGNTTLCDVIDNHIYEQTLVRCLQTCFSFEKCIWNCFNQIFFPLSVRLRRTRSS